MFTTANAFFRCREQLHTSYLCSFFFLLFCGEPTKVNCERGLTYLRGLLKYISTVTQQSRINKFLITHSARISFVFCPETPLENDERRHCSVGEVPTHVPFSEICNNIYDICVQTDARSYMDNKLRFRFRVARAMYAHLYQTVLSFVLVVDGSVLYLLEVTTI